MKFVLPLWTLLSSAFLMSCGVEQADSDSELNWAHTESSTALSIINSRVEYLQLQYKTDFSKITVCIQDSEGYGGDALLLETKLAYAAWLEASGRGTAETWNHFEFVRSKSCRLDDNRYSSVVVISEEARITADQKIDGTFAKNKVSCKRVGLQASCSTGLMTMGRGGAGSIGYTYFKPTRWESISNRLPATAILSPFVEWESLERYLGQSPIGRFYADLKAKAGAVTYNELLELNTMIAEAELKLPEDETLSLMVNEFLASKAKSLTEVYVPRSAGFHVLLHEVGHQFGMDHADAPNSGSVTGYSKGALEADNGIWTTELSTMAYADDYLYLTADDRAGISNLATQSAAVLKAHRGL